MSGVREEGYLSANSAEGVEMNLFNTANVIQHGERKTAEVEESMEHSEGDGGEELEDTNLVVSGSHDDALLALSTLRDFADNENEIGDDDEDDEGSMDGYDESNRDFKSGRWTSEEHKLFLKGLEKFGKEWKKIASLVTTRSLVQIRTHAQKHFLKMSKTHHGSSSSIKNPKKGSVSSDEGTPVPPIKRPKIKSLAKSGGKSKSGGGGGGFGGGLGAGRLNPSINASNLAWPGSLMGGGGGMRIPFTLPRLPPQGLGVDLSMLASGNPIRNFSSFDNSMTSLFSTSISTNVLPLDLKLSSSSEDLTSFSQMVADESFKKSGPGKFGDLKIVNPDLLLGGPQVNRMFSPAATTPLVGLPTTPITREIEGRTQLHSLVFGGDLSATKIFLNINLGSDYNIDAKDHYGFTALMTACCLGDESLSLSLVKTLLIAAASPKETDNDGFTSLHWAASVGHVTVVSQLIASGAVVDKAANNGDTALHRAARFGRLDVIANLIHTQKANPFQRNKLFETPYEVAGMMNVDSDLQARLSIRSFMVNVLPSLKTAVLFHEECKDHAPNESGSQGVNPWESPERIDAILYALEGANMFSPGELIFDNNFERAAFSTLARVHSNDYIRFVHELSKQVAREGRPVAFTPRVQSAVCEMSIDKIKAPESCDTSFSKGSLNAARRAAGAVCKAVDMVVSGNNRNAFCCVRPPGHHAGVRGLMQDSVSCGFCIFNNVAIGALHALQQHFSTIKKVAIIDIDVHHGNGTEEIVNKFEDASKLFFFSIHLFDKEETSEGPYEFYPGSGEKDKIPNNIINVPLNPLWKQENKMQSRGKSCPGHYGRTEFRRMIESRLLPSLRAYSPDLILISAGFDGAKRDVGNCRHEPAYSNGLDLLPEDFKWVTEKIMEVANITCNGRVVSVLEGGYGNYSSQQVGGALDRTNLAVNCAAHVRGLVGGLPSSMDAIVAEMETSGGLSKKRTSEFCVCNNKYEGMMIECSSGVKCNGWVHPECVGLSISSNEMEGMDDFVCQFCRAEGLSPDKGKLPQKKRRKEGDNAFQEGDDNFNKDEDMEEKNVEIQNKEIVGNIHSIENDDIKNSGANLDL